MQFWSRSCSPQNALAPLQTGVELPGASCPHGAQAASRLGLHAYPHANVAAHGRFDALEADPRRRLDPRVPWTALPRGGEQCAREASKRPEPLALAEVPARPAATVRVGIVAGADGARRSSRCREGRATRSAPGR